MSKPRFYVQKFINTMLRLSKQFPIALDVITHNHARNAATDVRSSLYKLPTASSKDKIAKSIKSVKKGRYNYTLAINQRGMWLDSMTPHYVSLWRKKSVIKWTKSYFGSMSRSGKSRISYTNRGTPHGALFVTPHPFIQSGLIRAEQRYNRMAKDVIKKVVIG